MRHTSIQNNSISTLPALAVLLMLLVAPVATSESDAITGWTYDEITGMWNYPAEWSYDQAAKAFMEQVYPSLQEAESAETIEDTPGTPTVDPATITEWTYDSSKGMWVYPESWSYEQSAKAWEEGGYADSAVGTWVAGSSSGTSSGASEDTAPSAAGSPAGTAAGSWVQDPVTGSWSHPEGWTYEQAARAFMEQVYPTLESGTGTSSSDTTGTTSSSDTVSYGTETSSSDTSGTGTTSSSDTASYGTGYAVHKPRSEPPEAGKLHLITRWLRRYYGLGK